MSRTLSIINAGNIFARNFLKSVKGYDKIILGDICNNRKSFLLNKNLKQKESNIEIEHLNIHNELLLENAIKNSNNVVYFTHDYFTLVEEKNKQLVNTANICKAYNVNKLIAINPLEFINYYTPTDLSTDPILDENNAQDIALKNFSNTTVVRTNLVFGKNSYFVKFLSQHWMQNVFYFNDLSYNQFQFKPVHYKNINDAVNALLNDDSNKFSGKKYSLNGPQQISFADIDELLRHSYSKGNASKINDTFHKLSVQWQLTFHGNTHVINFQQMLEKINKKDYKIEEFQDLNTLLGLNSMPMRDYYTKEVNDVTDMNSPHINKYWDISLD